MSNDKKLDEILDAVNTGFSTMQKHMDNQFNGVNNRLENLELKMTNVVYRFELQDLQARVEKLEEKMEDKK